MGKIGAFSPAIDDDRDDFRAKIGEQPPHRDQARRDRIFPEQYGRPSGRVQGRVRHESRTNNSPPSNRASWLAAQDDERGLLEQASRRKRQGHSRAFATAV